MLRVGNKRFWGSKQKEEGWLDETMDGLAGGCMCGRAHVQRLRGLSHITGDVRHGGRGSPPILFLGRRTVHGGGKRQAPPARRGGRTAVIFFHGTISAGCFRPVSAFTERQEAVVQPALQQSGGQYCAVCGRYGKRNGQNRV